MCVRSCLRVCYIAWMKNKIWHWFAGFYFLKSAFEILCKKQIRRKTGCVDLSRSRSEADAQRANCEAPERTGADRRWLTCE